MNINLKFTELRVKLRKNSKVIMGDVVNRHVPNISLVEKSDREICVFCSSPENLTKEHVIPQWAFGKDTKKFFVTDINESEQSYHKTTIPACSDCNNNLLSNIEKFIIEILDSKDLNRDFFDVNEVHNIIRWIEIIEYKFQILEIRRKFIKSKSGKFMKVLANVPISVMRAGINYSPHKAVFEIRQSMKRITTRNKTTHENSLVVFKSKNENFHFFHQMNDFIFIELPNYKIAIFYFYCKRFTTNEQAHDEAKKIIEKFY